MAFGESFFDRRPLHISYPFHGILPDLIIVALSVCLCIYSNINEPRFVSAKTITELDECGPLN